MTESIQWWNSIDLHDVTLTECDALLAVIISICSLLLQHGAQVHSTHTFVSKNTTLKVWQQRGIQLFNTLDTHTFRGNTHSLQSDVCCCLLWLITSRGRHNSYLYPPHWEEHIQNCLSVTYTHTSAAGISHKSHPLIHRMVLQWIMGKLKLCNVFLIWLCWSDGWLWTDIITVHLSLSLSIDCFFLWLFHISKTQQKNDNTLNTDIIDACRSHGFKSIMNTGINNIWTIENENNVKQECLSLHLHRKWMEMILIITQWHPMSLLNIIH